MSEEIFVRNRVWRKTRIAGLVLILLFTLASLPASAAENLRSLFIHAACDGKISSAVLSSLKEEIRTSTKYQLVPGLDDNGRMDTVLTIYMNCAERSDVAAVATSHGWAHCDSVTDCRGTVDGSSIRSTLCDAIAAAECGRTLFKAFDAYVSSSSVGASRTAEARQFGHKPTT